MGCGVSKADSSVPAQPNRPPADQSGTNPHCDDGVCAFEADALQDPAAADEGDDPSPSSAQLTTEAPAARPQRSRRRRSQEQSRRRSSSVFLSVPFGAAQTNDGGHNDDDGRAAGRYDPPLLSASFNPFGNSTDASTSSNNWRRRRASSISLDPTAFYHSTTRRSDQRTSSVDSAVVVAVPAAARREDEEMHHRHMHFDSRSLDSGGEADMRRLVDGVVSEGETGPGGGGIPTATKAGGGDCGSRSGDQASICRSLLNTNQSESRRPEVVAGSGLSVFGFPPLPSAASCTLQGAEASRHNNIHDGVPIRSTLGSDGTHNRTNGFVQDTDPLASGELPDHVVHLVGCYQPQLAVNKAGGGGEGGSGNDICPGRFVDKPAQPEVALNHKHTLVQ